jgi:hypothetical protein
MKWTIFMATVHVSDDTFRRLAERARALNITVEDLVGPALDQLTQNGAEILPLTGEAWQREFDAWTREIESRAGRYPPDFRVQDDRESIYGEREEQQR